MKFGHKRWKIIIDTNVSFSGLVFTFSGNWIDQIIFLNKEEYIISREERFDVAAINRILFMRARHGQPYN